MKAHVKVEEEFRQGMYSTTGARTSLNGLRRQLKRFLADFAPALVGTEWKRTREAEIALKQWMEAEGKKGKKASAEAEPKKEEDEKGKEGGGTSSGSAKKRRLQRKKKEEKAKEEKAKEEKAKEEEKAAGGG
eukprot:g17748.t1